MPFAHSDGVCEFCRQGLQTACVHVGFFGNNGLNGAQAEALRIPFADGTLYPIDVAPDSITGRRRLHRTLIDPALALIYPRTKAEYGDHA